MGFKFHDIGGYNGKDVEVWVFQPHEEDATPCVVTLDEKKLLRGAQGFDPAGEMDEEKVEELGIAVKKAIYGAADFGGSVTMLQRDLLQVARLAGNSGAAYNKLDLRKFKKVNLIVKYRDPNTGDINYSDYIGGFKARTHSKNNPAGGNAEVTVDGSAENIVSFDGEGEVVEHIGDGTKTTFTIPADTTDAQLILVESPAGIILESGYSYDAAGTVTFTKAPEENAVVRIVHTNAQ